MNAKHTNSKDDRLSELLHEWEPGATLPPRFRSEVWRRIVHANASTVAHWWIDLWQSLDAAFRRPALAVAYVAVLLVVGLSVGLLQSREKVSQLDQTLQARYVQSIDPYQKPR